MKIEYELSFDEFEEAIIDLVAKKTGHQMTTKTHQVWWRGDVNVVSREARPIVKEHPCPNMPS